MASRIMHLCIAKLVDEKISFRDKGSFYLGCLAPDRFGMDQEINSLRVRKVEKLVLKGMI